MGAPPAEYEVDHAGHDSTCHIGGSGGLCRLGF